MIVSKKTGLRIEISSKWRFGREEPGTSSFRLGPVTVYHPFRLYWTEKYLLWRSARIQARQWLAASRDRESLAAYTMFHLNRWAKTAGAYSESHRVYALKTKLIELFYEAGYCSECSRLIQKLDCRPCAGTGISLNTRRRCGKCGGDGVYKTVRLYHFAFVVSGRRYIWHQPESMVRFRVYPHTQEVGDYGDHGRRLTDGMIDYELALIYMMVVYLYLKELGKAPNLDLPGLRRALELDYSFSRLNIARKRFNQWISVKLFRRRDEIPF